jgi:hypothetical protein
LEDIVRFNGSFLLLLSSLAFVLISGSLQADDHQTLTISDIRMMSPDEIRSAIERSHDMCRVPKAERMQAARELQAMALAKQALVSQSQYDVTHYEVNFAINFTTEIISGYVTTTAKCVSDGMTFVELDLFSDLTVDSVTRNGSVLSFSHASNLITVQLGSALDNGDVFSVKTYYHGHPTEGGFQAFSFSTHGAPSVQMATTLSEPYFARTWWPCKDYPDDKADSVDVIIRHPQTMVCSSNGDLISAINNWDGTVTTHWHESYPITTYLVSICVTNYNTFSNWYVGLEGDSMPVTYWVYPENLSTAQASYPITVNMIGALSGLFGEYPFITEKYGMSQFGWGGAMEHQTNTSMNSGAYYQSIIVHELAHQWWGDMITCENWHEIWMNEGWASYCEALWFESQGTPADYRTYMNGMKYTSGGTIYCQDTTDVWAIFSGRVYDKGAWVLHMLRHVVGDAAFFDILQTYYDDPRYKWGDITTLEFKDICETVSGIELDPFFQDWIWGEYYPKYRYSHTYTQYSPGNYVVYLNLRQTQTTSPTVFDMPVDIDVFDGTNYHTFVVNNTAQNQDFILFVNGASGAPSSILVDRWEWILRTASSESYTFHLIYDPLSDGEEFAPYLDSLIAKGGSQPYTFSVVSGSLPTGLTLSSSTGKISGTPTSSGLFTFTAKAVDNSAVQKQVQYTINIAEGSYIPGDANGSGFVDIDDVVWIINYIFAGGLDPVPIDAGDVNGSCDVDVDDAVYLIATIFGGGPAPLPGCVS